MGSDRKAACADHPRRWTDRASRVSRLLGVAGAREGPARRDPQDPTLGRSHDRPVKALVCQHPNDLLSRQVGAKRLRAGLRDIPHRAVRGAIQRAGRCSPEKRALVARDQRERVRRTLDCLAYVGYAIGGTAQHDVVAYHTSGDRRAGPFAFERQVVRQPIDLPGRVVIDLGEPERFEPARGSWA